MISLTVGGLSALPRETAASRASARTTIPAGCLMGSTPIRLGVAGSGPQRPLILTDSPGVNRRPRRPSCALLGWRHVDPGSTAEAAGTRARIRAGGHRAGYRGRRL